MLRLFLWALKPQIAIGTVMYQHKILISFQNNFEMARHLWLASSTLS